MMLYKNRKEIVRSPDGDTVFWTEMLEMHWHHICLYTAKTACTERQKMVSHSKRQEADDILQKLWQMQTTQATEHFSQIHQPKQNPHLCNQQEELIFS